MKNVIRSEELAMFGISIYGLVLFNAPWWCYAMLVLGPDISMIGYAVGNRVGAFSYNLFHHKGLALAIFLTGLLIPNIALQVTGVILFGHSSMDRVFGYGLKYNTGFGDTHLGPIGRKNRLEASINE